MIVQAPIYTATEYDSLVFSAIENINASQQNLWLAAENVWTLCVEYSRHEGSFVAAICESTGRERSSIYDLRNAHQLKRLIVETYPHFEHVLSTSFYSAAYDAKNTMPLDAIVERMEHAAANRLSVRDFRELLLGGELTQDKWQMAVGKLVRSMQKRRQDAELVGVDQEKIKLMGKAIALWQEVAL